MQNKEEIISKKLRRRMMNVLIELDNYYSDYARDEEDNIIDEEAEENATAFNTAWWYIQQLENKVKKLETEKQKLIEKLEEQANRKIPLAEDRDYIQGYRDLARDLLEIVKGENE